MPYINDVLASNARTNQDSSAQSGRKRLSRFRFDPDRVIDFLKSRIIGQPEVHDTIGDLLHVVKADFASGGRPLGVFLFMGSTGVGKTETVRVLAEAILGSADEMCRIDMNTLAQEHYAAAITGAPPGYVGSKENHSLFDHEKVEGTYSKPGIVLFDEIEKASAPVARALLNILDTGTLELSAGNKRLDFTNAMIFMTSNEGAKKLEFHRSKTSHGWRSWLRKKNSHTQEKEIIETALRNKFDPEFINRIDRILHYQKVGNNVLDQILTVELEKLEKRLAKYSISINLSDNAREYLLIEHDSRYGARHLKRRIRMYLEPVLARAINRITESAVLNIICVNSSLSVEIDSTSL